MSALLLLQCYANCFETLHVFWSWSEDVHVVLILPSDYFLKLFHKLNLVDVDLLLLSKCKWASTRENLSSGVCEQNRRRPACASAQSDQRLCYSRFGKYYL